jgi:inosose dehydratase
MKTPNAISRRDALKLATITALGLPLAGALRADEPSVKMPEEARDSRLKLGVASVSFSKFSADEVIAALKTVRITNVSLYKTHCPWDGTAEACRAAARKFTDAGLTVTGSGVIDLPNNEASVRKSFENARAAGLPTMVCKPALDAYPLVEKFVKEFDLKLAVHNHGPEDKVYPSPYIAWDAIQAFDKRIGLCIDVGHAARSGVDPVEAIHKCHTRLYDIHFKDSTAPAGSAKDEPVEVGRGRLNIKGMLAALLEVKYQHIVAFEYEKRGNDQVAGLAESVAYVRKVLAELVR